MLFRSLLRGNGARRHAITLTRLQRWFRAHQFQLTAHRADLPFAKDLWVAAFVRTEA